MDMFMDKLAQKLTAQEIIKANTAAEVEELTKLRNRVAEYNDCLDRLQKLIEEGENKLESAQVDAAQMNKFVALSVEKIRAMQQDEAVLEQLQSKLTGQLAEVSDKLEKQVGGKMEEVSDKLDKVSGQAGDIFCQIGDISCQIGDLSGQVSEVSAKLDDGKQMQGDELAQQLATALEEKFAEFEESVQQRFDNVELALEAQLKEKFAAADDNVHKECVKVYRNVQAVITEKDEHQTDMQGHILGKLSSQKGRMKIVMAVTITSLVLSLVSIGLQILGMLGVNLF